ncbi:MAG: hypothetical protein HC795_00595 [Coleofasciculaceae cyanobacterium RL_1_1]|nr:hypothetical protein [Coleofasciculaceae cyanobacterium RL_1_1]
MSQSTLNSQTGLRQITLDRASLPPWLDRFDICASLHDPPRIFHTVCTRMIAGLIVVCDPYQKCF